MRETRRRLPARLMMYFLLGRALFSPDPYREVLRKLIEPLRPPELGGPAWRVPDKAAVFRARGRLGWAPLRELPTRVGPVATERTPGAFWGGLRLMVLDGTTVEVADTAANDRQLGRPGPQRGRLPAGYPQARIMALIETGTHVVVDAEIGAFADAERTLARPLLESMGPGMLILGDRGLPSVRFCRQVASTGAELLWRGNLLRRLPVEQMLPDGSWISTAHTGRRGPRAQRTRIRLRVIEYTLERDPARRTRPRCRLITTLLDHTAFPADELAASYSERWEAETTLAEIKTSQIGARVVLPSKTPELVRQEIYAHLAVHAAGRALMHRTATHTDPPLDPDRLSFTAALRAVRRSPATPAGAFPPEDPPAAQAHLDAELLDELNPPRRLRTVIRQVKRKMSRFLAWNPERPRPLQPSKRPLEAVSLVYLPAPAPDT